MRVKYAIIGGGTAGLTARAEIAKKTDDYIIIERKDFGTTCAKIGCMPSKALIHLAEDYHGACELSGKGFIASNFSPINGRKVMEHVRFIRDQLSGKIIKNSAAFDDKKIMGEAYFIDEHTLQVGSQVIEAEKIIIATGSTPSMPESWRQLSDRVITSDQVFELKELPDSMAIIGLGPIGLELGQAFSRLGVKIAGFDMAETISGISDPEITKFAIEHFGAQFSLQLGVPVELKRGEDKALKIGDQEFDFVLLAMGRIPNLQNLKLENVKTVQLNERGMPSFNPQTMRIQGTDIFIAGDVNNYRPILHEASDEGRIAAANSLAFQDKQYKRKVPMGITFTDPNIAFVGKRFQELNDPAIGSANLAMLGRTIAMNRPYGQIRVYGDRASGVIVGAEIAGAKAENLVHFLAVLIEERYTVEKALNLPFYHPVVEESLKNALRGLAQNMNIAACEIEEV